MAVARSIHILIVDDSKVARQVLAALLRSEGFVVSEATTALEAREAIARSRADEVDLILLDLHLPDGSGIELCSFIKRHREWEDVPVILVTSSDDEADLTDAFAVGATDYITKPPREVELRARIRAALRLKQEMHRRKARECDLVDVNRRLVEQAGELTAARSALVDLNRTLEQRVEAQVDEILQRAREIEALNAQLRIHLG